MSYHRVTIQPSDDAGAKFLNGQEDGAGEVLACLAVRALFVAPFLMVAGVREGLVKKSLAASAGVTVFGLALLKWRNW